MSVTLQIALEVGFVTIVQLRKQPLELGAATGQPQEEMARDSSVHTVPLPSPGAGLVRQEARLGPMLPCAEDTNA
jgi:hypothetical protein